MQLSLADHDGAQALLHGAAELAPDNSLTWVLLGVLYHELGPERSLDAKSCNLEAKRLGLPFEAGSAHLAAARFCLDLHVTALAEAAVAEEQAAAGASFGSFAALGELALIRDDFPRAEQSLREALALDGSSAAAWALLGDCNLAQGAPRAAEAIQAYRTALACTAKTDGARHAALLRLGELCVAAEQFDAGREAYFELVQAAPTASGWLGLGLAYVGLGDLGSAEECLSEANICNNTDALVWGHLTLLALRTHREGEANLAYKEALKLGATGAATEPPCAHTINSLVTDCPSGCGAGLADIELLQAIGAQQLELRKFTLAEGTLRRCLSLQVRGPTSVQRSRMACDILLSVNSAHVPRHYDRPYAHDGCGLSAPCACRARRPAGRPSGCWRTRSSTR